MYVTGRNLTVVKTLAEEIKAGGGQAEAGKVDALNETEIETYIQKVVAAMAILGTHLLPKWTARMALIIAVFHFGLIPSIFSGADRNEKRIQNWCFLGGIGTICETCC